MKFQKNDKVRIINTGDIWEGRIGLVYEEQEDEVLTTDGRDLTQVDVLLTLDTEEGEKSFMKNFNRENLEKVQEESLTERIVEGGDPSEGSLPQVKSEGEFINLFVGKEATFLGFDYEELFPVIELEDGSYGFSAENEEEVQTYKAREGSTCTIAGCTVADWEPWMSTSGAFLRSRWDIDFGEGERWEGVPGTALEVKSYKSLAESFDNASMPRFTAEKKLEESDIIKPFVYKDYGDEKLIPCWTFAGRIMDYYGVGEETLFAFCKEYGHKAWSLHGATLPPKLIIAAKEITKEDIMRDYADFVDGCRGALAEEIKL